MANEQPCDAIVRLSPLYQELALGEYRGPPELEASRARYTGAQGGFIVFSSTGLEVAMTASRRTVGLPMRKWPVSLDDVGES